MLSDTTTKNVFKSSFIQITQMDARVIDTNALAAKRIEENSSVLRELPNPDVEPVYDEDGNLVEDPVSLLTGDMEEEQEEISLTLDPEEIRQECEQMIRDANDKAAEIRENAKAEANAIKEAARTEGQNQGYNEGYEKACREFEEQKNSLLEEKERLNREYMEYMEEVEPKLVETITEVYRSVFGKGFYSKQDVITTLVNKTLMKNQDEDEIVVHISSADFEKAESLKTGFLGRLSFKNEPEIRLREDLPSGSVKIETPYGVMDCGIDTELKELKKALLLLAGQ